jgi:endo-1,4-beta-xylanase
LKRPIPIPIPITPTYLLSEGHLIVNSFERTVQENFQRFADLGLEIAITELDIRMTLPATNDLLQAQAENYAYIVKSCVAVSKCVGITTWDTSDDVSSPVNSIVP